MNVSQTQQATAARRTTALCPDTVHWLSRRRLKPALTIDAATASHRMLCLKSRMEAA